MDKKVIDLLKRLLYCKYSGSTLVCPDCNENWDKYGHRKNCELALILNENGEVEKFQE